MNYNIVLLYIKFDQNPKFFQNKKNPQLINIG
jgi:hypothetical protein